MTEIKYIGKCLVVEKESEKILVVGDLHLGYGESIRKGGVFVPVDIFGEVINDLDAIFERVGKIDEVVLLGDVKHEFGRIMREEWREIGEAMNYLRRKAKKIIVIKGNHDPVINSIVKDLKNIELVDYYIKGETCFLHGDRDFPEIHEKGVRKWVMGHVHPAVVIEEEGGSKKEKYKCFLEGVHRGRKIIIVPSFFPLVEGSDPRYFSFGLVWDFKLENFNVKIIDGSSLDVLDFGKLKNL